MESGYTTSGFQIDQNCCTVGEFTGDSSTASVRATQDTATCRHVETLAEKEIGPTVFPVVEQYQYI